MFEENPDDPGAAHYLIHAADAPQLAQTRVAGGTRYAQIAPAAPHVLHMPSHIFARLGLWHEDIQSNLPSLAAAQQRSAVYIGAENQIHAMEFLEYAYLQIGEDDKAKAMVAGFGRILRQNVTENLRSSYFDGRIAYFPALYVLEMHRWKEAVALQPPAEVEPNIPGNHLLGTSCGSGTFARSCRGTLRGEPIRRDAGSDQEGHTCFQGQVHGDGAG